MKIIVLTSFCRISWSIMSEAYFVKKMHEMYADPGITEKTMKQHINIEKDLVKNILQQQQGRLESLCENSSIPQELMTQIIETATPPPFLEKLSLKKLEKLITHYATVWVEPKRHHIGVEEVKVRTKGISLRKFRPAEYYSFNLLDTILGVLRDEELFEQVVKEKFSPVGVIEKDIDGINFRKEELLPITFNDDGPIQYEIVIRLSFYSDGYQIAKSLGSKTRNNKVVGFYYKIMNLVQTGRLDQVFMFAIIKNMYLTKFGYNVVMREFVRQVANLSEGKVVSLHGKRVLLKVKLCTVSGDSEGCHVMLNFMSCSATRFCRICHIARNHFNAYVNYVSQNRSEEHFRFLCQQQRQAYVRNPSATKNAILNNYGYKSLNDTVLARAPGFKPRENLVLDCLHDLYEGFGHAAALTVLRFMFQNNICNDVYVNDWLSDFDYGKVNNDTKPSPNLNEETIMNPNTKKLHQYGSQMHLMLRILPLITVPLLTNFMNSSATSSEKRNTASLLIELISSFNLLSRLISCKQMTTNQAKQLKDVVENYNYLYATIKNTSDDLYVPNPINKNHHAKHLWKCSILNGPPSLYACWSYEAFNKIGADRMKTSRNFKNPAKTIAKKHALRFSFRFSYKEKSANVQKNEFSVTFRGITYMTEMVVVMGKLPNDGGFSMPLFAKIHRPYLANDQQLLLEVQLFETVRFDNRYGGYQVLETENFCTTRYENLLLKYPQAVWRTCETNNATHQFYICPKTEI